MLEGQSTKAQTEALCAALLGTSVLHIARSDTRYVPAHILKP